MVLTILLEDSEVFDTACVELGTRLDSWKCDVQNLLQLVRDFPCQDALHVAEASNS